MSTLDDFLNFVLQFPYWSQVVTGLISLFAAWVMALRTSKNETLKQCRDKRLAVYDEAIAFLDELRVHPGIALEDDFYITSLKLGNHLRAYGSKKVVNTFRDAMRVLRALKRDCDSAIEDLNRRYMPIEFVYDDDGKLDYEKVAPQIDMSEFEELLEKEKASKTMSARQILDLLSPILKAINKSISNRW